MRARTSCFGKCLSLGVRKWAQGTMEGSFAICSCGGCAESLSQSRRSSVAADATHGSVPQGVLTVALKTLAT